MVVKTNVGKEYLSDYSRGIETDPLDTLKVGTGTTAETAQDTQLESPAHSDLLSSSNISIVEDPNQPGYEELYMAIKGGTQVDGGTTISEIGYFVGAQDLMVFRDTEVGLTVNAGRTGEVMIPIQW